MTYDTISSQNAKTLVEERRAVLIDVREPSEYAQERISGSINIPLSTLSQDNLKPFADKTLIMQCRSGARSQQACQKIKTDTGSLYNLEGGIVAWKAAALPTETSGAKGSLPLMQQVQLTIGIFVLAGTVLSYFISPVFLLVPFVMGAGLINAGLTGWCGLAKAMAMMPWNRR